jgi:hypothetical protein
MKNPIDSKTIWFNLVLFLTANYVPVAHEFFVKNYWALSLSFFVLNSILRMLTHEVLTFKMPVWFLGAVHSKSYVAEMSLFLARKAREELREFDKEEADANRTIQ